MYQHLLLALEFDPQAHELLQKAYALAEQHQAKLSVIHAVDFIPLDSNDPSGLALPAALPEQLVEKAQQQLTALLAEIPPPASIEVSSQATLGSARHSIIEAANELAVDLILVGHHQPHGLGHLLGHVDESVVHHAPCDVLAVKLSAS